MKKTLLSIAIAFFIMSASISSSANEFPRRYVPNQIIVKFKSSTTDTIGNHISTQDNVGLMNLSSGLTQLNRQYRVKKISPLIKNFQDRINRPYNFTQPNKHALKAHDTKLDHIYKIELDLQAGQTIEDAIEAFKHNPDIEYAEPDYYVTIDSEPNDPMNFAQWSLRKIEAQKAWDIYTGNPKTVVAVIDTGVDYNHPDLHNNMWINEFESNGVEGIDDDNNGYVDDIFGYNFLYRDSDPLDDHGHIVPE